MKGWTLEKESRFYKAKASHGVESYMGKNSFSCETGKSISTLCSEHTVFSYLGILLMFRSLYWGVDKKCELERRKQWMEDIYAEVISGLEVFSLNHDRQSMFSQLSEFSFHDEDASLSENEEELSSLDRMETTEEEDEEEENVLSQVTHISESDSDN
jgi:hypothetical protein